MRRSPIRPRVGLAIAVIAGLALTGCGDKDTTTSASPDAVKTSEAAPATVLTQEQFIERAFDAMEDAVSVHATFESGSGAAKFTGEGDIQYGDPIAIRMKATSPAKASPKPVAGMASNSGNAMTPDHPRARPIAADSHFGARTHTSFVAVAAAAPPQTTDSTTTNASIPRLVATPAGMRFNAVSADALHACAIANVGTPTGDIYCWGSNDDGRVGDGTTTGRPSPVRVVQ